ncbi:MAG: EFR1 family ferrodoxin [Bacteroidales bacterium]|nr:EFR1 family ferrodoxin [Bacteroidales bacterium]
MIFYYSGCGNSRHVAEQLAARLGQKLVFIPQAARREDYDYALAEGESLGFVFPIYSWQPPRLVLDFVERLRLAGAPGYIYMVTTYGDDAGMADRMLDKVLAAKGLRLDAAFGVAMPNTYVNMSFMNIDPPEVAQRKLVRAEEALPLLARSIRERRKGVELKRGVFPRTKTYAIGAGFNQSLSDKAFHATDACVSCGRCVEVCPLRNIALVGGRPRWNGHCTHCEACYHYCPQNAVQFGRATRGKGQYHYSD